MKNFILNKKIRITFISCLVVIVLVFIGVTAMKMVAKDSSIGTDAARKFALIDAGVKEKNIKQINIQFAYKDSAYVYDVEFETGKKEYCYYINASNGVILEKKIIKKKKPKKKKENKKSKSKKRKTKSKKIKSKNIKTKRKKKSESISKIKKKKIRETTKKIKAKKETKKSAEEALIGMDEAKSIAISSAGESSAEVVFTLARLDGNDTYQLQFYNGNKEYNYSIDAKSGSVISGYSNTIANNDTDEDEQ